MDDKIGEWAARFIEAMLRAEDPRREHLMVERAYQLAAMLADKLEREP